MHAGPDGRAHARGVGRARRFVARYGWRAYALPVLSVITVWALWPGGGSPAHQADAPATDRSPGAVSSSDPSAPAGADSSASQADSRRSAQEAPSALPADVCAANAAGPLVLVSLTHQHVWMCDGTVQVYDTPATSGEVDNGDATPVGTWQVQSRETERYLEGPGYRQFVHYWMPFDGDFGFHDASWQTIPFGSSDYRTAGSNGCIHLPLAAAQWLYDWSVVGVTTVTVQA